MTSSILNAQVRNGELRLHVQDPAGFGLRADVELQSEGNQLAISLVSDAAGNLGSGKLPYGFYTVRVTAHGFAPLVRRLEVRTPVAVEQTLQLALSPTTTSVDVNGQTLIDPYRPSSVAQIGAKQIADRVTSLPGRSIEDLVNTQPGWLYEGNAVLHPRGSEYQTQFVVNGVPLTDNRSPSFGPELEADDVESLNIYTAGFPAEYGRKLGGVIELNTKGELRPGVHGELELSGGSYATAQTFGQLSENAGRNSFGVTASGSRSNHYLNPVVPDNFTNDGTTGDFSARFGRDITDNDRLLLDVRHELSRFEIPNELLQQQAGQLQTGDNFETIGTANYRHTISPTSLVNLSGFVRDTTNDLYSNASSTPIIATQHIQMREGYFKATYFKDAGRNQIKAGLETDSSVLHEDFAYTITDPTQFNDGTPPSITPFIASRPDLEQAAFIEDLIRLDKYTVSAGLRWDHYQLLANQNAFSPRLSVSRYFPRGELVVHASYDRIFQTPSNENVLISSSSLAQSLNPTSLGLPVQPSHGNYYEAGVSALLARHVRADVNYYRRDVNNYADDDQLLNTGVSYPIAFQKGILYGGEAKLQLVKVGKLTGFVSYSYIVGQVFVPITGGLFLGDDATNALTQLSGHFPDSQDERNTVRTRFQYQAARRVWFAAGLSSDSGLPFQFDGAEQDAFNQYGASVVHRLNFTRGRVLPSLLVNASGSVLLHAGDRAQTQLQVDGTNLIDQLDVIDFGGLFSGNAIGPGRSFGLRLTTSF